jgi:hypothetical protein
MGTDATKPITLESIIECTLRCELTRELAQHAAAMGTEAMIAVALLASARIAEQDARLLAQDARIAELSAVCRGQNEARVSGQSDGHACPRWRAIARWMIGSTIAPAGRGFTWFGIIVSWLVLTDGGSRIYA